MVDNLTLTNKKTIITYSKKVKLNKDFAFLKHSRSNNTVFGIITNKEFIMSNLIDEKIYKREDYLKKVRGFYNDNIIKVITGIRRCGKSFFLKSIIEELLENGVDEKDIIYIELDRRGYKNITTPKQLEKLIDSQIKDDNFKYLFIDEVQNVKNYEKLINSYNEEGNFSIFLTGSNSYLLSGELMTKLTGRYIEIEMMPLTFYEYVVNIF